LNNLHKTTSLIIAEIGFESECLHLKSAIIIAKLYLLNTWESRNRRRKREDKQGERGED
jgi:hypothetical protein